MRARPVRRNIYLPVVRFGVADSDWFSVLIISCASYLLPVPFGVTLLYVPLQMWTWLFATAGCIAFFNYIRIGRKPHWLQHQLKALYQHHRQSRVIQKFGRPWIVDSESKPLRAKEPSKRFFECNIDYLEAADPSWKELLPTTN